MNISLLLAELGPERDLQENFRRLQTTLKADLITSAGWKKFDETFIKNDSYSFQHGLSFIPEDVLQTRLTGTGTIVYEYVEFTRTHIKVTVSGTNPATPLRVKFLVGKL